jgi:hypothetical protein
MGFIMPSDPTGPTKEIRLFASSSKVEAALESLTVKEDAWARCMRTAVSCVYVS